MTQQYYNPFAGISVIYPTEQGEDYRKYSRSTGQQSIDQRPFERMIDLWFAGLSLAVHRGLSPLELSGRPTSNMTPGSIFDGADSWRIQVIQLIAVAMEDVEVLEAPNRMMNLANGLAAAGAPYIIDMLQDGDQPPVWNLTEALENAVGDKSPGRT